MNILWFTWKDLKNPLAGGAELVNEELAKRLVADGHSVKFLVGGFEGGAKEETIDGYHITRIGNRFTVYWHAYKYYKKHLKGWADIVIDEVNTIPFFAKFYVAEKNILFVHQLARQIWFHEMIFPLSLIGYLLEPLYLRLLSNRNVITVSNSTKQDLLKCGFKEQHIHTISEGITLSPVESPDTLEKYEHPTMLALGSIRSMKRTHHTVKAFEHAKKQLPNLKLIIAGKPEGRYGKNVLQLIENSPHKEDITYLGKVSNEKRQELMQRSHVLCVTSVKEGWGLVVTEANSQGTPAVVYNVDGLRDAVKHNQTGLICKHNTPKELAENITNLLSNNTQYQCLQHDAWNWSKEINFDNAYNQFKQTLSL